jgi:hypothetical protein
VHLRQRLTPVAAATTPAAAATGAGGGVGDVPLLWRRRRLLRQRRCPPAVARAPAAVTLPVERVGSPCCLLARGMATALQDEVAQNLGFILPYRAAAQPEMDSAHDTA